MAVNTTGQRYTLSNEEKKRDINLLPLSFVLAGLVLVIASIFFEMLIVLPATALLLVASLLYAKKRQKEQSTS